VGDARDPATLLALIAREAPALRRAGVTELVFDGVSVKLAPHVDESVVNAEPPPPEPVGWDDPSLYGLPKGAQVPGFKALREKRKGST
jgi:hypothetical protein